MAVIAFPLDAVDESPNYTGRMLRETLSVLVGGGSAARPLAGGSGVNPRTPSTTVTASANAWTVKAHGGYIDAQPDSEASGYLYAVTSSGGLPSGAMAAANATNPRIDLISVQISDPAEGDGSPLPKADIVYTTGPAAASPTVPAAPARSMVLARIAVPKFGGGNPVVTWLAPVMRAPGVGHLDAQARTGAVVPGINEGTPAAGATPIIKTGMWHAFTTVAFNNEYAGTVTFDTAFPTSCTSVSLTQIQTGSVSMRANLAIDTFGPAAFRAFYPGGTAQTERAFLWTAVGY